MKLPISVIVLTYNEEQNIEDCLKGISGLFEVVFVVDSFSTDKTLALARKFTEHIYEHPFENYSVQRNWAQANLPIRTEWVLHLDADEQITPELLDNLNKIFSHLPIKSDGFLVSRRTIFRGRWIKHGGHYPVYHLRTFKKHLGKCEERLYDQHFLLEGKIAKIKGDIINVITGDLNLWQARHRKWASLEAEEVLLSKERIKKNVDSSANPIEARRWLRYNRYYKMPLFIRPFMYFFYRYIIKLGFLDGIEGLVFHFYQGLWYRLIVDINIYKLKRKTQCIS